MSFQEPTRPLPSSRPLRLIDQTLPTISENLAFDEALLVAAEEGRVGPILRFWELDHLAVVLGASGRSRDDVIAETCLADGVAVARRSSGGGTVVIGPGALNFAVVLPIDFAPGLDAVDKAQRYVLERVAQAIRDSGPEVRVRGSGDLTVAGRKISGSAQRRLKRFFLVHASVLYNFPLDRISRYTRSPARQPDYREQRSHADFVANLPLPRAALVQAITRAWPIDPVPRDRESFWTSMIADLVITKLGRSEWVWRF